MMIGKAMIVIHECNCDEYSDEDYYDDNDGNNDRVWLLLPTRAAPLVVYSIHWNQDVCDDVQYDIHENDYDD